MNNLVKSAFLSLISLPVLSPFTARAQDAGETTEILSIDAIVRADWQINNVDGQTIGPNTGFEGKYLGFRIDGRIVDGLTYSWRQRLYKPHKDAAFFDATDWIYLNYKINGWNFSAGKEIVAIGGYEYDVAPFNVFGGSVFWNNIPCYELGASIGYDVSKNDRLTIQATQSPFFSPEERNMYAYNLMWTGSHGIYSSLWSANIMEYAKGRYISYIALGNQFDYGRFRLQLDFMNRASSGQTFFFKDCSVMADLAYHPTSRWAVHAKYTYDVNHSDKMSDLTVLPGTELSMAGAAVEFYPLKKKRTDLRLHAAAYYSWGKNANGADLMQNKTLFANVGLTWHMNIFTLRK